MRKTIIFGILCSCLTILLSGCSSNKQALIPWEEMKKVEANIQLTNFPDKNFIVTDYGANKDADISDALMQAIADCHEQGGGKVIVPEGTYYTKAIHLLSNVNLYISKGATLKFSTNPNDYMAQLPTRWEGVDCMGCSPLIYANGQTNIAITGEGVLDGQASWENWWKLRARTSKENKEIGLFMGKEKLQHCEANEIPMNERIFTVEDELRPQFIQVYNCDRVLIEGLTFHNAPFWILHPLLSKNIVVRGNIFDSHGPNNDGCDPESCENVLIEKCVFNTGDDCIAIKSGKNNDGRRWNIPSKNIIVRNCTMKDGHAAVAIGSEISGSCYNVWMENCTVGSPDMDRPFRIKSNAQRGGTVKGFYIRNINISECKESVLKLELYYNRIKEGLYYPRFEDIVMENITCQKSRYGIWVEGYEDRICVSGITLKNCTFDGIKEPELNSIVGAENISYENCFFNGKSF